MTAVDDIRTASARFYAALNSMAAGNAAPMATAWIGEGAISAQHPIGGRSEGHATVMASFAKVAEIAGGGDIRLIDARIDAGNDMAVETGVESGTLIIAGQPVTLNHRVTNVYRKIDGAWKMAHHHADPSEAMLDVLRRLPVPA